MLKKNKNFLLVFVSCLLIIFIFEVKDTLADTNSHWSYIVVQYNGNGAINNCWRADSVKLADGTLIVEAEYGRIFNVSAPFAAVKVQRLHTFPEQNGIERAMSEIGVTHTDWCWYGKYDQFQSLIVR